MTEHRERDETAVGAPGDPERRAAAGTRCLVVGPYATGRRAAMVPRPPEARLDEALGLAAAIDLDTVEGVLAPVAAIRPSTYLGKGRVDELAGRIAAEEVGLVVMDCALSPVQQRNLEKAWSAKVIDRTGLILEIFGRRARTREGALQVEHAHLAYQRSRLVRSWTHLERQRGGFGFLGGPGETQIEADRRQIQERMAKIERDLETVARTRGLHRQGRRRVPYPIVALVGYTNAGKSTLFNRLTAADVFAENLLFATLDPTSRAVRLPHGETAILSDTVGFISDLPTMLVAAFRATLEDVIEADVLLHVRDVSHEDSDAQRADVAGILVELGVPPDDPDRLIEVWNKADLLDPDERARLANLAAHRAPGAAQAPALVSALTGEGFETLLARIEARLARHRASFAVVLDPANGRDLHWLYENTEVLDRRTDDAGQDHLVVRVAPEKEPRFLNRCRQARRLARA